MRWAILGVVFLAWSVAGQPPLLDHTAPLELRGDLAAQMVEGIHRYLTNQTTESVEKRDALRNRDYSSRAAYESSIAPQRERTLVTPIWLSRFKDVA